MRRIIILLIFFLITVSCDKRDFNNSVASTYKIPPPGNLRATQDGEWIRLNWDIQKDITGGWLIERKSGNAQFSQLIILNAANLATYTDTTITTGTAYSYRIQGFSDENKTGYSAPVSFTAQFPAPTDLSASVISDNAIKLTWDDNCDFEQGYRVQKNNGSGFTQIAEVSFNTTTFTDNTVQWDNEQAYRVLAFTIANQSQYSNETPYLNLSIAAAPTDLRIEEDITELRLTWQDNCDFEEGFRLERSANGGAWVQIASLPANITEYSDTTSLQAETSYSYRIYAYIGAKKSAYSNQVSGKLLPSVTDIDGNVYKIVKIGSQWWMAENLKVTRYRNGESIPNITDNGEWSNLSTGAYCAYNNDNSNIEKYGLLYNWYAVVDSSNIAPEGWHVPTDADWKELEMYLGMSQSETDAIQWRGSDEGSKLKAKSGWYSSGNGTNESGFTALPGGYRDSNGAFSSIVQYGYWWSSTGYTATYAWSRRLYCYNSAIGRGTIYKRSGLSVRLVRD